MQNDIIGLAEKHVKNFFDEKVSSDFTYHNLKHTFNVVEAARKLANEANLEEEEIEVLVLASLFHDIGFGIDPGNHEHQSTQLARSFLEEHNYNPTKIDLIINCILATKKGWKGKDKLCCLMKDADLSGLAAPNYNLRAENLRKELNTTIGLDIDKYDWLKENITFIQNHSFFSDEGRKLYNKGKQENLSTT